MKMTQYDSLYDLFHTTLFTALLILVFLFSALAVSSPPLSSSSLGIPEVEITPTELTDMVTEDPDLQKIGCYSVVQAALPAKFAFSKKLIDRVVCVNNGGMLGEAGCSTGTAVRRNNKGGLEREGTASDSHSIEADDDVCVFCLNEFGEGDMLRALPGCNHVFHADCIDQWLTSHNTCPRCRLHLLQPR